MPLKFNEALEFLLEDSPPAEQPYANDAAEISAKINQEFTEINSIFKGTIINLDKTWLSTDNPLSKKCHPFLWLKVPFKTEPQQVHLPDCEEGNAFYLMTSVNHPAVRNGFVMGDVLVNLFHSDMNRVMDRLSKIACKSGKSYKLCYDMDKEMFTIQVNEDNHINGIWYSFALEFSFSDDSVFYASKDNLFFRRNDSEEEEEISRKAKIATLLLMKIPDISLGFPVYEIINSLADLRFNNISDFLFMAIKLLIPLTTCPGPLRRAFGKLLQFKQSDSVEVSELKDIFGLH
ncbi:uncharacterized protein LOC127010870 [Drosophila biarmipes]|uniref:uncharacterized protein LOC127010870 n=1 Tax=Drosophila biarmipes TaxID=125945 RepID=UPI0021CC6B5D|nr:uncharacterized protein LOC127010870 [Drosophila biarmipes]